jgi:hypothetical protein
MIKDLVKKKLGKHLLKKMYMFPTYKHCLELLTRVVIFSEIESNSFWNLKRVVNEWPNSDDVDYTADKLENSLQKMKYDYKYYNMISFILTPQKNIVKDDVIKRIFVPCKHTKNSVKKMTQEIQSIVDDFYEENENELYKLSSVLTDYPTIDFINKVVNLNFI